MILSHQNMDSQSRAKVEKVRVWVLRMHLLLKDVLSQKTQLQNFHVRLLKLLLNGINVSLLKTVKRLKWSFTGINIRRMSSLMMTATK